MSIALRRVFLGSDLWGVSSAPPTPISFWVLCLFLFSDSSDGTFKLGTLASCLLEMTVSWEGKADATDGLAMTQMELASPLGGLSKQNVSIWVWRKSAHMTPLSQMETESTSLRGSG